MSSVSQVDIHQLRVPSLASCVLSAVLKKKKKKIIFIKLCSFINTDCRCSLYSFVFMGCRYVNTLLKLVPQVLALQEQLREAVQNGDMETCHGICRIAVTLGENHSRCVFIIAQTLKNKVILVSIVAINISRNYLPLKF